LRRAFTLIELLVIVGILAVMVTMGILSVRSGQDASRLRAATRDVYASIRRARSQALVSGQSAVLTYSTSVSDDGSLASVEIHGAELMAKGKSSKPIETLSGEPLMDVAGEPFAAGGGQEQPAEGEGEGLADILFQPLSEDVMRGVRLEVVMEAAAGEEEGLRRQRSKISVFSNVDYILGKFKEAKSREKDESAGEKDVGSDAAKKVGDGISEDKPPEPVSVVWYTNGRVDPHRVRVYLDGSKPESGLMIKVDRFGAAEVMSGDGGEAEL
jgi:Tfp pilus assembly major pilin PilA